MPHLCSPWLAAEDITQCSPPATPQADIDRALLVGTGLLWAATGRQWPGRCVDLVRPCGGASGPVQMLDYPSGLGSRPIAATCGCGASTWALCSCRGHDAVALPGRPVSEVLSALVDGVAVETVIVDDHLVLRADERPWPCCQNLHLANDAVGAWSISYAYGSLPPPHVLAALEDLVCQLAASYCQGDDCPDCQLPQRITQLTYENATATTFDPFTFLEDGLFGIYSVDQAVSKANPYGLAQPGRVRTAADWAARPHRVRPGAPPPGP